MENRPPYTPDIQEPQFSNIPWETHVALMGHTRLRNILVKDLRGEQLPEFRFPSNYPQEYQILNRMYELDRRTMRNYATSNAVQSKSFIHQRASFYKDLATEIKDKRRYYLFGNLLDIIPVNPFIVNWDIPSNPPDIVTQSLAVDLSVLHLAVSRPDRLLVGIKDGVYWKRIEWPNDSPINNSKYYLSVLPYIGQRELITVPEHPMSINELSEARIPNASNSAEDLLESAYYEQRYLVPTEGAEVRFKKAGDLEKMVAVQSGNLFFTKMITNHGEIFAAIDINNGHMEHSGNPNICIIAAGVYHDLVTAIEMPRNRFKSLKGFKTVDVDDLEETPQYTLIPRIVRTGTREERPVYDGPPRPMSPYRVRGHRRLGNLTEQHRRELLEFERKHNVSILDFLPAGYTFVRPHFVPSDSNLDDLPIFIKRRIQSRIQEELQKPENSS